MLSSRIINSNDGVEQRESRMPGSYREWAGLVPNAAPSIPTIYPLNQQPPPPPLVPAGMAREQRVSFIPAILPTRRHPSRPRSMTPDIVIERRRPHRHHHHHHHHNHHHGSSRRHRILRIPFDDHPTLGLRGPPKRILEIERVPCHRNRKRHSSCYEIEYDDPPPQQPNVVVANPMSNPYFPSGDTSFITSNDNSFDTLALISSLTPEMIQNLPKQTVYLPPIHMPGSQADANTVLNAVVFPAEIINPVDGSLSILKSNSTTNPTETADIQPIVPVPSQSLLPNLPPRVPSAPISGPFMQQVQNLFQRLVLPRAQSVFPPSNNPIIQPLLPIMPQYNAATNEINRLQTIPQVSAETEGPYPPANIRQINPPNNGPYNSTATLTPYNPSNSMTYRPANITPYQSSSTLPFSSANTLPYHSANITPYQSVITRFSNPTNNTPYRPANITPNQPSSITSSNPTGLTSLRPTNFISSNPTTATSPYRPANITPYSTRPNFFTLSSSTRPSISSGPAPYISSSSNVPSDSFNSNPLGVDRAPRNLTNSTQSSSDTRNEPNQKMPKSILRNPNSNTISNTTYTRLNPRSVSPPNGIVRKKATLV
ncbi:unnamed protein product [Rotaria socialis]|uniref:Uncharacterized protein n=1 Tax=Rotaria socialis TaxID=392032 RepID=A0A821H4I5_9BILA|nr:unnamed protein product [Rotaria socialis]CAF4677767.1 unnamed protein product [Rotaria socialis]